MRFLTNFVILLIILFSSIACSPRTAQNIANGTLPLSGIWQLEHILLGQTRVNPTSAIGSRVIFDFKQQGQVKLIAQGITPTNVAYTRNGGEIIFAGKLERFSTNRMFVESWDKERLVMGLRLENQQAKLVLKKVNE